MARSRSPTNGWRFDRRLTAFNSRVDGFLDGGWTDRPSAAFADVFREWNKGTGDCRADLSEMAGALGENARAYVERDSAIAESLPSAGSSWEALCGDQGHRREREFHVDIDGLGAAIEAMQEFERWWEDALARLDFTITNPHTTWLGDAAAAHKDAYTRWINGTAELRDTLARLRGNAVVAHGNYSAAADTGSDIWRV